MTTSTNKALSGKINRVKQVNKKTDEKALIKIGSNELFIHAHIDFNVICQFRTVIPVPPAF